MTIKEYAASRGITYEAARQVIKRHREELGEHAASPGKNQALELDAVAVELLDGWRASSPVVVQGMYLHPAISHSTVCRN